MVIDNKLRLPKNLNLFDQTVKTFVFNSLKNEDSGFIEYVKIDFTETMIPQILKVLYSRNLQSVIIEGGKQLLDSFIGINLWDEAFQFVGNKYFGNGIIAPKLSGSIIHSKKFDSDQLFIYKNNV